MILRIHNRTGEINIITTLGIVCKEVNDNYCVHPPSSTHSYFPKAVLYNKLGIHNGFYTDFLSLNTFGIYTKPKLTV